MRAGGAAPAHSRPDMACSLGQPACDGGRAVRCSAMLLGARSAGKRAALSARLHCRAGQPLLHSLALSACEQFHLCVRVGNFLPPPACTCTPNSHPACRSASWARPRRRRPRAARRPARRSTRPPAAPPATSPTRRCRTRVRPARSSAAPRRPCCPASTPASAPPRSPATARTRIAAFQRSRLKKETNINLSLLILSTWHWWRCAQSSLLDLV